MKYQVNIGDKYGLLTVKDIYKENNKTCCECLCECGNIVKIFKPYRLATGVVKSCGCLVGKRCAERNRSNAKYEKADSRLHDIWRQMHQRCENPSHISYKNYGAKGICVCEDWGEYVSFKEWALKHGYNDSLTIDRINSTQNYMPSNCRWVSVKVQNNNSSHCHYITYNGKTQSMSAWAEELGVSREALKDRISKLGWSVEKAFETPINKKFSSKKRTM